MIETDHGVSPNQSQGVRGGGKKGIEPTGRDLAALAIVVVTRGRGAGSPVCRVEMTSVRGS